MKKKLLAGIFVLLIAWSGVQAYDVVQVVYEDDFESYAVANPAGADFLANWTVGGPGGANASRTWDTTNFAGTRLWISLVDGTSITSNGIDLASDTNYAFSAMVACETFDGGRQLEATYDLLVGADAGTATSLLGGPVTVIAAGDNIVVDDSKEDHFFTEEFTTGTLIAGDKLFVVITMVGPYAGSKPFFCVDDVSVAEVAYNKAELISPADGETGVAVDTNLSWTKPLSYDPVVGGEYQLEFREGVEETEPNWAAAGTEVVFPVTDLNADPDIVEVATPIALEHLKTYHWRVTSYEPNSPPTPHVGPSWSFTTVTAAAEIETDPVSQTVEAGVDVELVVTGINITDYQWYKDGTALSDAAGEISGATTGTLTIIDTQEGDEGVYTCVVDNGVEETPDDIVDVSERAVVMTRRLVSHWDFEGASSIERLTDSEDGRVGVFTDPNSANDPPDPASRFVAGFSGDGFEFKGDDLFIEVADNNELFNFYPQGLTVACWVTADANSTDSYSAMVAKHTYSAPRAGFIVTQGTNSGVPRFQVDGWAGLNGPAAANVQDGQWHHVVMTFEPGYDPENPTSTRGRVYVDGGGVSYDAEDNTVWLMTSGSATGIPDLRWDVPLRIGADDENGAGSLSGIVDEVKIWSYARTPAEVASAYTSYTPEADDICLDEVLYDFDHNCKVDLPDFVLFAAEWLNCNLVVECP